MSDFPPPHCLVDDIYDNQAPTVITERELGSTSAVGGFGTSWGPGEVAAVAGGENDGSVVCLLIKVLIFRNPALWCHADLPVSIVLHHSALVSAAH